jgi:hypothetical protein
MTRRLLAATLMSVALAGQAGEGYLRWSTIFDGRRIFFQVSPPSIRYFVTDLGVPGVSSAQLQATLVRAGQTWQDVPTATIGFQSAGFTGAQPGLMDDVNAIGFLNEPDLEGVLAVTLFVFDTVTGDMVEADIFFNSIYDWSVAEDGEEDRFDLESTALHEMGHMLGLTHSGLGQVEGSSTGGIAAAESVMFPLSYDPGVIAGRRLKADDIAGVSLIYPDGGFRDNTGSILGRVQLAGRPVFGAHVMAFQPGTGTMIAGFTYENGEFLISGLAPGPHILRVEPIDDAAPSDYFEEVVDVAFKAMFFDRLVTVQRGATTPRVDIVVEPQ